jgi:exodeoxyribonuclease VII large subunit
VDNLAARLENGTQKRLARWQNQMAVAAARLTAVSPQATLLRGYAIVRDENGRIIRSTQKISGGDPLNVQVADGAFAVTVNEEK